MLVYRRAMLSVCVWGMPCRAHLPAPEPSGGGRGASAREPEGRTHLLAVRPHAALRGACRVPRHAATCVWHTPLRTAPYRTALYRTLQDEQDPFIAGDVHLMSMEDARELAAAEGMDLDQELGLATQQQQQQEGGEEGAGEGEARPSEQSLLRVLRSYFFL